MPHALPFSFEIIFSFDKIGYLVWEVQEGKGQQSQFFLKYIEIREELSLRQKKILPNRQTFL